jgi:hypothetical protein
MCLKQTFAQNVSVKVCLNEQLIQGKKSKNTIKKKCPPEVA